MQMIHNCANCKLCKLQLVQIVPFRSSQTSLGKLGISDVPTVCAMLTLPSHVYTFILCTCVTPCAAHI